jgi:NADH-quinone oxidoreductase subunit L
VVTFVSLMVHVYTIGYMEEDPGYQRFFSYISLFTFSMLMLVMSNNFLQLFFGWEAVGLVSYLLIGFWFKKPTAVFANMKAFLVNRVGDFGFILGIGLIVAYAGTLNYGETFAKAGDLAKLQFPGTDWMLITVICICLFIGAMGKSAQFPLHVWLPDSMEGPTPISALIHAATMVTAGIFMVARMSPLFELSDTALNFVLVIGAITALFMGFLGIIQNDIKRVVAYSTLSQLGYMTVALGVSAYSGGGVPPDDARLLQGAAVPGRGLGDHRHAPRPGHPQHGRPAQVHAHHLDHLAAGQPGADRHAAVRRFLQQGQHHRGGARQQAAGRGLCHVRGHVAGVFVTAFYSFRMYFLVFHGKERFHHKPFPPEDDHAHDDHGHGHDHTPHESPWVVWLPLVAAGRALGGHRLPDHPAHAVR